MTAAVYQREDFHRVIFQDLPERCDEALLHELALQFGPVQRLVWPTEQTLSGAAQRKTKCFVYFEHPEDAKYCYQVLAGARLRLFDRPVKVLHVSAEVYQREKSGPERLQNAAAGSRGLHEVGAKVVVRNINHLATEFDITSFFQQFGAFAAPPRMLKNREGNFRGVAILSYKDFAFSDRVIRDMHGRVFKDRVITVEYAELEDGSGRLHGSPEERETAALIHEEERKYLAKLESALQDDYRQQQHTNSTAWADPRYNQSASRR
eukprot:gene890-519_t